MCWPKAARCCGELSIVVVVIPFYGDKGLRLV